MQLQDIIQLLNRYRALGVKLWVHDGKLRFKASAGALTTAQKLELKREKVRILSFLASQDRISDERLRILPVSVPGQPIPLSFAQSRLWFIEQFQGPSANYNVSLQIRAQGLLQLSSLEWAINEIVARHESLRTRFGVFQKDPVQLVAPMAKVNLLLLDIGGLHSDLDRALLVHLSEVPFSLESSALLRVTVLRLASDHHLIHLCMHHITSDGWSLEIFKQELLHFYIGAAMGGSPSLPALPIQYADFAVWQRSFLQGAVLERQLAFWHEQLSDLPQLLEFPSDFPRPNHQSSQGAKIPLNIPSPLTDRLNGQAKSSGSSLFMVLLAGFAALLSRYSNQNDLAVGSPVANRNQREIEPLIGFFVNTLVFRVKPNPLLGFSALLDQVRRTALGIYQHQDLPFEKMVETFTNHRSNSHPPLFQVMLVLQTTTDSQMPHLPGLSLTRLEMDQAHANFHITIDLLEHDGQLVGSLIYNTDLFQAASMVRFAGHLINLLDAATARPDQGLAQLQILSESQQKVLLSAFNRSEQLPTPLGSVLDLIHEQVRQRPDACAVLFDPCQDGLTDLSLSYAQLDQHSNQLALRLLAQGIGLETAVGICVNPSLENMVALLAVLKAGAFYVPLDPELPSARLQFMIEDSDMALVLVGEDCQHLIAPLGVNLQVVVAKALTVIDTADENELRRAKSRFSPDNAAYLIYTSGSSGRPKAVLVSHGALHNLVRCDQDLDPISPTSRVLQLVSFSFDVSVYDWAKTFSAGATLIQAPRRELLPGPGLMALFQRHKVDRVFTTPTQLAVMNPEGATYPKMVSTGGEILTPALAKRWCKGRLFLNVYGPTETCVISSMMAVHGDLLSLTESLARPVPLGLVIDRLAYFVTDRYGFLAAEGVVGELSIAGPALARGYLGKPGLTAEKFVPHAFSSTPGARLYRSGDLVRLVRLQGEFAVDFVGRADFQVKIRGLRIELGEIEAVFNESEAVAQVFVLTQDAPGQSKQLIAYVLLEKGVTTSSKSLLEHAAKRLPTYMIPSQVLILDTLPTTPSGKFDRAALPSLQSMQGGTHLPANTATEATLVQIWADLLERPAQEVGINDSFFELGGHSLLATRMVNRIGEQLSVTLPVRQVFEQADLQSLAAVIQSLKAETNSRPLLSPSHEPVSDLVYPQSFAQRRLWLLDRMADGASNTYNIPSAFRLIGRLSALAVEQALAAIVARHESLRTFFDLREGRPCQIVRPSLDFKLGVCDLRCLSEPLQEVAVSELRVAHGQHLFQLESGPLLLVDLLLLKPDVSVLLLNKHHIISDGWSMIILINELQTFYGLALRTEPMSLPALTIQYGGYSVWQQAWLADDVLSGQLDWWRQKLTGCLDLLPLPLDRPRPTIQTYAGSRFAFRLGTGLSAGLNRLARASDATLFMLLLAVFADFLARYCSEDDLNLGTPEAGRHRADLEPMIGFFINTLVMRIEQTRRESVAQLINSIKEMALGAWAHADIPFEKLVDELNPERDMSHAPLFQVMFVLQNTPPASFDMEGLTVEPLEFSFDTAKYDLTLSWLETNEGLLGSLEYNTDLFDRKTIVSMAGHLENLLASYSQEDPAQVLSRRACTLSMLSSAERSQLLATCNDQAYPHDFYLFQMVEGHAAMRGEHTALVFKDQRLSYAQLNQKAGQLACCLTQLGVSAETHVGVLLERSPLRLISFLAVIKAGGVYLPLTKTLPDERLQYILADCDCSLVVADSEINLPDQILRIDPSIDTNDLPVRSGKPPATLDQLAYLIYTSGSTGQPKGVAVPHRGLINLAYFHDETMKVGPDSRVAHAASALFDASIMETLMAWSTGASMYLADEIEALPGHAMASFCEQHAITHLFMTPSSLALMPQGSLSSVTTLVVGAEMLSPELVDRFAPGRSMLNAYGPSEVTIVSSQSGPLQQGQAPTIGAPVNNVDAYVVDASLQLVPIGVPGELVTASPGLARGYLGRPSLTAQYFVCNAFAREDQAGSRLYRSGDLVRRNPDGTLSYMRRLDSQIKLRGFRIELGEVESALRLTPGIANAAVSVRQYKGGKQLLAHLVPKPDTTFSLAATQQHLKTVLPAYMVPGQFACLEELPLLASGKLNRRALSQIPIEEPSQRPADLAVPSNHVERQIASIWARILELDQVDVHRNFFDMGGNSLLMVQVHQAFLDQGLNVTMLDLFGHTTVSALASFLHNKDRHLEAEIPVSPTVVTAETEVAVIGYAGRFPGAPDVDHFWQNLCTAKSGIVTLSKEALLADGEDPALIEQENYVPMGGFLEDIDLFDAGFFEVSPAEAALLDPQHRLFLENAWQALEHAGYHPGCSNLTIGVYAGAGFNYYFLENMLSNRKLLSEVGIFSARLASDNTFLATRVAYKLNLRGPAISIQTACSTSLVAVHMAAKALIAGECNMALAGGISIGPGKRGYLYQPGMVMSSDGACRSFDAEAEGTVGGNGTGIVVLKRSSEAQQSGDTIYAVIKGSAMNNDGADKVGFTAPSVAGQTQVIKSALAAAGVQPDSVGYVETHGSATPIGDPIEAAALLAAFKQGGQRQHPCLLGAVKSSVGHLDTAAGIAGLIKTIKILETGLVAPNLHYRKLNPNIDFGGMFRIADHHQSWPLGSEPRRAGVSSFGIGGTNAHVVLEQPPLQEPGSASRWWQLVLLSARTEKALADSQHLLADYLELHPDCQLADVAHTLQLGRATFSQRAMLVATEHEQVISALRGQVPDAVSYHSSEPKAPAIVYMFPGPGDHYLGMLEDLKEPVFREHFEKCNTLLKPILGQDLALLMRAPEAASAPEQIDFRAMLRGAKPAANNPLDRLLHAHLAVFAVSYAMAQQFRSWGLRPSVMIGYSLGEYVAATLAGVFTLEDALSIVAGRARLIEALPQGAMLSVVTEAELLHQLLPENVWISATTGPNRFLISGTETAVASLEQELAQHRQTSRRLSSSHAIHCPLMAPLAEPLSKLLKGVERRAPQIPYISSVTGTWITPELATDPAYWVRQIIEPVAFYQGVTTLLEDPETVFLELGPGQTLSGFVMTHPDCDPRTRTAASTIRSHYDARPEQRHLLEALGQMWLAGATIDWSSFYSQERRRRLALPSYPFQRKRYWLERSAKPQVEVGQDQPYQGQAFMPALSHDPNEQVDRELKPSDRSSLQNVLAAIWQQVLGLEQIQETDHFFKLGGDSLVGTRMLGMVDQQLGIHLPVSALFQEPTFAQLAAYLTEQGHSQNRPPLRPTPMDGPIPQSFAQQRLWFLYLLEGANPNYNIATVLKLTGQLSVQAVEESFDRIIQRHETLRTSFAIDQNKPVQQIRTHTRLHLPVSDMSQQPEGEAIAYQLAESHHRQAFALDRDNLIRITLLIIGPNKALILHNMHHIISDGWSMGVFLDEFQALYGAIVHQQEPQLEELPIQYRDYTHWQRAWLNEEELTRQVGWWREHLDGIPALLELPTDRPRPAQQTLNGNQLMQNLDEELTHDLKLLGQQHEATMFMVLLTIFADLLARYSNQNGLALGTPAAGRNQHETERMIGFFVNTLVIPIKLDRQATVAETIRKVRETCLGAWNQSEIPFEKLVDEINPVRDMSHSPLFQVMIVLQNTPMSGFNMPGLKVEPHATSTEFAKFDLALNWHETPTELSGTMEYNTDLFDQSTIERILTQLVWLSKQYAGTPSSTKLNQMSLLSESEHYQILYDWNQTAVPYPHESYIHQLVEAHAHSHPDDIAAVYQAEQLSYAELDLRAGLLAQALLERGVRPGVTVAVLLERSLWRIISFLAVLKTGGVYIPLVTEYPIERLAFILENADCQLLVTRPQESPSQLAERFNLQALHPDQSRQNQQPAKAQVPLSPQQLAYVIYTSGSTGQPKGVMIPHTGLYNLALYYGTQCQVDRNSRVVQLASAVFDAYVMEVLLAWSRGGTLYIATDDELLELSEYCHEHQITHSFVTPSALAAVPQGSLGSVKHMMVGAEQLSPDLVSRYCEGRALHNVYGPTETTVIVTHSEPLEASEALPPIGKPLPNVAVHVVDVSMRPVPIGVHGELVIDGPGLAWGYQGQPALTATVFIPNPYPTAERSGARLYRSGDLVRRKPDSNLEFVGRIDHQIKLRGFRIELGEIEAVLEEIPTIKRAVVQHKQTVNPHLVAYVRVEQPDQEAIAELKHHLKQRLPHYMVPAHYVFLTQWPMNTSGKIDYQALPAYAPEQEEANQAPEGVEQEKLAQIWAKILETEQIGKDENFFDLGGHSLLVAQMANRILETFAVTVSIREIFEHPQLTKLAQLIQSKRTALSEATAEMPPLEPNVGPEKQQSLAQGSLWFLDRLEGRAGDNRLGGAYNVPAIWAIKGPLQVPALRQSIGRMVTRHAVLRSIYPEQGGSPQVRELPPDQLRLRMLDISQLAKPQDAVNAYLDQEKQYSFNLAEGPLFRASIIRQGATAHHLVINQHHIITDGWSLGVLQKELTEGYAHYAHNSDGTEYNQPLPLQYTDFAHWQQQLLAAGYYGKQLAWWRTKLAQVPSRLDLTTDQPRPAQQTFNGAMIPIHLDPDSTRKLANLCQEARVTTFMALHASLAHLLARYSGQEHICIGSPVAGRSRTELEPLLGYFVNTLAIPSQVRAGDTFEEHLAQTRQTVIDSFAHQDIPFDRVVEALQPDRDMSHSPLFQVMLSQQNIPNQSQQEAGIQLEMVPLTAEHSKYEMTWEWIETSNGLQGSLTYNSDLYEPASAQRLVQHYKQMLSNLLANPGRLMQAVPLTSQQEQEQLQRHFNRETSEHIESQDYPEQIRQRAQATPKALAISQSQPTTETRHSYEALDQQSEQLAERLRSLGVQAEVPVGLYMEATPARIIAQLAISKAGGYIVAIEPSYPQARRDYIIEDSQITHLVSDCTRSAELEAQYGAKLTVVKDTSTDQRAGARVAEPSDTKQTSQNAAYLNYTTGTTGQPKGTLIAHKALSNMLDQARTAFGIAADSRVLHPIAIEDTLVEWAGALSAGASLYQPEKSQQQGSALMAYMQQHQITHMKAEPSQLAKMDPGEQPYPRTVITAGTPLPPDVAETWSHGRQLYNAYGPNEATVYVTVQPIDQNPKTIGQPLGHLSVRVEDRNAYPVPLGVPGELLIGGAGLARGYYNEPRLTAEKFVPQDLAQKPGSRSYRSGDRVRIISGASGPELQYLGRIEQQAKRKPQQPTQYKEPETANEKMLARIWGQLMGQQKVSSQSHFFEMGGHSLLAVQVRSRIQEELGQAPALSLIFAKPVLAELALALTQNEVIEGSQLPLQAQPETGEPDPLSLSQNSLWFLENLEQREGKNHLAGVYNLPAIWQIRGPLNVKALNQSLQEILKRHRVLRTIYPAQSGRPTVAYLEGTSYPLTLLEISTLSNPEDQLRRMLEQEAAYPFDLARDPLFRAKLYRLPDQHVLIINQHHIISDGWSMGVLEHELMAGYERHQRDGQAAPSQPLAVQYRDYAHWQQSHMGKGELARQIAWWKQKLAQVPDRLELLPDKPPPAWQTYPGASQKIQIEQVDATRQAEIGWKTGTTTFMAMHVVLAILLSRYSQQQDICIGSPVAGRSQSALEPLLGYFVNIIAVPSRIDPGTSYIEHLRQAGETILAAFANQEVPFDRVVEAVRPPRDLSQPPLFQVMLTVQNLPKTRKRVAGIQLNTQGTEKEYAKYPLSITILEGEAGLEGSLNYNTDLYEPATANRMVEHFKTLLAALVNQPDQPIRDHSHMTQQEKQELLNDYNQVPEEPNQGQCLHQIFAQRAQEQPQREAIVYEPMEEGQASTRITYDELDRLTDQLASQLQQQGIRAEEPVGLCLPPSPEMYVAVLGVLKAGGYYVPLDPDYPSERLNYMIKDARLPLILVHPSVQQALPAAEASVQLFELDRQSTASHDKPISRVEPENAAYLIYTSGSTGQPKGVVVAHRSVSSLVRQEQCAYGITPDSRILQLASFSFDTSVSEWVNTLCSGATLYQAPRRKLLSGTELAAMLTRTKISHMVATPSQWALLNGQTTDYPQVVMVGGEASTADFGRQWIGNHRLINRYGPTEATICSSWWTVDETTLVKLEANKRNLPLGKPLGGIKLYVLDREGQPVSKGVAGELHVGGQAPARGYLRQPGLTAAKFVPDPYASKPGQRHYRTGDLVRFIDYPDGLNIDYLGRIDHQVKLRGNRIELGEIEASLRQAPEVSEAVVIMHQTAGGERQLVAFLQGDCEQQATRQRLRQELAQSLPEYMIPARIHWVASLALTKQGKIDRRKLAAQAEETSEQETGSYRAPRTRIEAQLQLIWAGLLERERVSIDADFFEQGGHSLMAVELTDRIHRTLATKLPVSDIFQHRTIAELAQQIGRVEGTEVGSLVTLAARANGRPWYLIHPVGGQVHWYLPLAGQLAANHPVYALQAGGISGQPITDNIQEIAASYAEAIQSEQPHGPYLLAGWSAGGTIALEIARELERRGEETDRLVLLDAYHKTEPASEDTVVGALIFLADIMGGVEPEQAEQAQAISAGLQTERQVFEALKRAGQLPDHLEPDQLEKQYKVYRAIEKATSGQQSTPYHGSVLLVRASEGAEAYEGVGSDEVVASWQVMIENLDVQHLSGNHYSLLAEARTSPLAQIMNRFAEQHQEAKQKEQET